MQQEYDKKIQRLFEKLGFFVESSEGVKHYLPRPVTPDFYASPRRMSPASRVLEADPEQGSDELAKANVFAIECTTSRNLKEIKNTISQCIDYASLGIPAYLCLPDEVLSRSLERSSTVLNRIIPLLGKAGVGLLASEPRGIRCVVPGKLTLEGVGSEIPPLEHLPVTRFRVDSDMIEAFNRRAGFKVDPLFVPSSIWLPQFPELGEKNRLAITLEFRLREEWLDLTRLLQDLLAIRKQILAHGNKVCESWVVSEGPGENGAVVGFDLPSLLSTFGDGYGKFNPSGLDEWPLPIVTSESLAVFSPKWYQCHFAYAIFFRNEATEHDVAYLSGEIRFGTTEVHVQNFEIASQRINLDYQKWFRKWASAVGVSSFIEELDFIDYANLPKFEIVGLANGGDGFVAVCKGENGKYFPAELIGRAKFLAPVMKLQGTAPIMDDEVPKLELGKHSTGNAVYRYAGPVVWSQLPMLRERL